MNMYYLGGDRDENEMFNTLPTTPLEVMQIEIQKLKTRIENLEKNSDMLNEEIDKLERERNFFRQKINSLAVPVKVIECEKCSSQVVDKAFKENGWKYIILGPSKTDCKSPVPLCPSCQRKIK